MVKELVNDHRKIPVIDIFAGPGGLGEGFSAFHVERKTPFSVALSIEKDRDAHTTLVLRNFYRQFTVVGAPEAYYEHLRGELDREELYRQFPAEAKHAMREAWRVELGAKATARKRVQGRVRDALQRARAWVLVGGPPCQAYSIAGRSRNRGVKEYRLEGDERHRLYEEFLRIVSDHWPPVFVMENVKGLLSASIRDDLLFGYLLARLQVNEIHRKWTRSRASMAVSADCSGVFEEMIRDYGKVVGSINASLTEPNETDRIAFALNEAEWAQFLRRLGVD